MILGTLTQALNHSHRKFIGFFYVQYMTLSFRDTFLLPFLWLHQLLQFDECKVKLQKCHEKRSEK